MVKSSVFPPLFIPAEKQLILPHPALYCNHITPPDLRFRPDGVPGQNPA